jgi:hypothetical protein
MAAHGRPALRDLFDESPTPHIAHPPRTHHRDFYVATDGSYRASGDGGLGVVIETVDGARVARVAVPDGSPDNNVAEYRALHLGLDVLADRVGADASVGVLVDHDELAGNVNAAVLAAGHPEFQPPRPLTVPPASRYHWRGIRARLSGFGAVRAARIDSDYNPAHPLANAPGEYRHLRERPAGDRAAIDRVAGSDAGGEVPPPSRRDRGDRRAGD